MKPEDLNKKLMEAMRQLMCTPEFEKCQRISELIWLKQKERELASFADVKTLGDSPRLIPDHEKLAYWESLLRCNKEHEFEELAKELSEEVHKRATVRGEW